MGSWNNKKIIIFLTVWTIFMSAFHITTLSRSLSLASPIIADYGPIVSYIVFLIVIYVGWLSSGIALLCSCIIRHRMLLLPWILLTTILLLHLFVVMALNSLAPAFIAIVLPGLYESGSSRKVVVDLEKTSEVGGMFGLPVAYSLSAVFALPGLLASLRDNFIIGFFLYFIFTLSNVLVCTFGCLRMLHLFYYSTSGELLEIGTTRSSARGRRLDKRRTSLGKGLVSTAV